VTRPDRRRGRGSALGPSPVKHAAQALGLPVTDHLADVTQAGASLGIVVAFGRLVPEEILERLPMINVHFSMLPRWRGAAPVERAILAGDTTTGVSLMRLDVGLDTGPLYASRAVPVGEDDAPTLRARLAGVGATMLVELLAHGVEGIPEPVPQVGTPRQAPKIEPQERRLEWGRPARELARVVRIGDAWTTFRGRRLRILKAEAESAVASPGTRPGQLLEAGVATGDGVLRVEVVQMEGAKPMALAAWRRGARPGPAEVLGVSEVPAR
jgi:methionyl-tRNA formyltransferase